MKEFRLMKKLIFMWLVLTLIPSALPAQTPAYPYVGREGKAMALGEMTARAIAEKKQQSAQQKKENKKPSSSDSTSSASSLYYVYGGREGKIMAFGDMLAGAFARKAAAQARALDAQNLAQREEAKASAALKALISAYPEHSVVLSKLLQGHENVVRFASEQKNEKKLAEELNLQLKYLYGDFASLRQANADVAAQVQQILNHEYWVVAQKDALKKKKMKNWVHQTLTDNGQNKIPVPAWYKNL